MGGAQFAGDPFGVAFDPLPAGAQAGFGVGAGGVGGAGAGQCGADVGLVVLVGGDRTVQAGAGVVEGLLGFGPLAPPLVQLGEHLLERAGCGVAGRGPLGVLACRCGSEVGAIVGGCLEYLSLVFGYRALLVLAGALYVSAYLVMPRKASPADPVRQASAPQSLKRNVLANPTPGTQGHEGR